MWNVAGAPPNSTGAPGRMTWAIVIPARTSTVWKTVAPTTVTGAIRPISVTGTISTGMPASTQSIMFWHESSLYRKLPVAVIVKMLIGRAMRSARPSRNSSIISAIRGTPCSVNAPETTGFFEFVRVMNSRHASETCGSMSSFVENAVARYGMLVEAVAEADVLDEVGRVREPGLAGPVVQDLQAGRARDEVDAVAAEVGVRRCRRGRTARTRRARSRSRPRRRRAGTGPGRSRRCGRPCLEEPPAHLRAADLHARLGQDAHRLVDDPPDELVRQDVQGGSHQPATLPHPRVSGPRAPPHRDGRRRGVCGRIRRAGDRLHAREVRRYRLERASGDVGLLLVALLVILAGAELFTNGIEWFGRKLDLAEGAVGSVLAAVGTAMPETMIPLIAILFTTGDSGEAIGVGAVLGAPFMLATLAMFVTGVAVLSRGRRSGTDLMLVDKAVLTHDLRYYAVAYAMAIGVAFVPTDLWAIRVAAAVALVAIYAWYVREHFRRPTEVTPSLRRCGSIGSTATATAPTQPSHACAIVNLQVLVALP